METRRNAAEGIDFKTYSRGSTLNFLCLVFPCVESFQSSEAYHNHALYKHGLFAAPTEIPQATSRKRKRKTGAKKQMPKIPMQRKNKSGKRFCDDYPRLRGTVRARWKMSKRAKWKGTLKKASKWFEVVHGPEPEAPSPNVYIEVLQRKLKLGGYAIWDCLLDAEIYSDLLRIVRTSAKSNDVYDWCVEVSDKLGEDVPSEESKEQQLEWHAGKSYAQALKGIFKKRDWQTAPDHPLPVRWKLIKEASAFLEKTQQRLKWLQDTAKDKIEARAKASYAAWKIEDKEGTLHLMRQNVYACLTRFYGMTSSEAIEEGTLEATWVDSSEDESASPLPVPKFVFRIEDVDEFDVQAFDRQEDRASNENLAPSETVVPDSEPEEDNNTASVRRLSQRLTQRLTVGYGADHETASTADLVQVLRDDMLESECPAQEGPDPGAITHQNPLPEPASPLFCVEDFLGSQEL